MYSNEKELFEFIDTRTRETMPVRSDLSSYMAMLFSYYQGQQWIRGWSRSSNINQTTFNPVPARLTSAVGEYRVTDNVFTRFVLGAASKTRPYRIYADVTPPDRDAGPAMSDTARVCEAALGVGIDTSSYLRARQDANLCRCIAGTWVVGLRVDVGRRNIEIDGQQSEATDRVVRAFEAPPTRLMLDPAERSRDLRDHECVVYHDVMSCAEANRTFGLSVRKEDCKPIGTIMPFESTMAGVSGWSMFSQYRYASTTPGVLYYQVHERGPDGRFGTMYIVVETGRGRTWINAGNAESPFGGDGLPLACVYGHTRGTSPWGISDGAMLKDGQDKRNTLLSIFYEHVRKSMSFQWRVDSRWFGHNGRVNEEDVRQKITNAIGGVIVGTGSADRTVQPPEAIITPPPANYLNETLGLVESGMRSNVFRAEVNDGQIKSHTSEAVVQRALDEAGTVLGQRVSDDITMCDEKLLPVLLGTISINVREMSPATLGSLRRRNFTDDDLGVLASIDPTDPPVDISVKDSSIRQRSNESRANMILQAASPNMQMLDPASARFALAMELDDPLVLEDRTMLSSIQRRVSECLAGEEWDVLPLGEYQGWAIKQLRMAMADLRFRRDPGTRDRILRAIESEEMAAAPQQAPTEVAEGEQPEGQDPIGELVRQIEAQSGAAV